MVHLQGSHAKSAHISAALQKMPNLRDLKMIAIEGIAPNFHELVNEVINGILDANERQPIQLKSLYVAATLADLFPFGQFGAILKNLDVQTGKTNNHLTQIAMCNKLESLKVNVPLEDVVKKKIISHSETMDLLVLAIRNKEFLTKLKLSFDHHGIIGAKTLLEILASLERPLEVFNLEPCITTEDVYQFLAGAMQDNPLGINMIQRAQANLTSITEMHYVCCLHEPYPKLFAVYPRLLYQLFQLPHLKRCDLMVFDQEVHAKQKDQEWLEVGGQFSMVWSDTIINLLNSTITKNNQGPTMQICFVGNADSSSIFSYVLSSEKCHQGVMAKKGDADWLQPKMPECAVLQQGMMLHDETCTMVFYGVGGQKVVFGLLPTKNKCKSAMELFEELAGLRSQILTELFEKLTM